MEKEKRDLLKKAVLGGAGTFALTKLPEKWTKPVVESVVLPAHAETSDKAPK